MPPFIMWSKKIHSRQSQRLSLLHRRDKDQGLGGAWNWPSTQAKPAPAFSMTLSSRWSPSVASPNLFILACTRRTQFHRPRARTTSSNGLFLAHVHQFLPKAHWGNTEIATRIEATINCGTATTVAQPSSPRPPFATPDSRPPTRPQLDCHLRESTYTTLLRLSRPQMA